MGYLNISVFTRDIANELRSDGATFADLVDEVSENFDQDNLPKRWKAEFLENLSSDGRSFVKALATAIEAGEASKGGA